MSMHAKHEVDFSYGAGILLRKVEPGIEKRVLGIYLYLDMLD